MIYICIPVRDEARTLGVLLWKFRKVMAEFGRDYEIILFDDGSTDDTREILDRYHRFIPLRVIGSESPVGYGPALERLLRDVVERSSYPKRDVAVTIQGDFSENPEDMVAMVKSIEGGADLVAGKPLDGTQAMPPSIRLSRWLAPLILGSAFTDAPVADPLAGFRAYRVVVLKKALRQLEEGRSLLGVPGWGANLELLSKAVPHARRIEEAPFRRGAPATRERVSRFRAVAGLRALLPLRGTSWPAEVKG